MILEVGTSEFEAYLYTMRQRYSDRISAVRDAGAYVKERDHCLSQIEKINFILVRIARRNEYLSRRSELDLHSSI